jgi:hypothetical protein
MYLYIYIYIYIYECHHQTGIGFHEANILKGASIQKVLKSRQALKYSKGWRHEIAGSPLPLRPSGTLRRKDKIFLFSTLRYINLISTVTCVWKLSICPNKSLGLCVLTDDHHSFLSCWRITEYKSKAFQTSVCPFAMDVFSIYQFYLVQYDIILLWWLKRIFFITRKMFYENCYNNTL